jgi:hypothetical protein
MDVSDDQRELALSALPPFLCQISFPKSVHDGAAPTLSACRREFLRESLWLMPFSGTLPGIDWLSDPHKGIREGPHL